MIVLWDSSSMTVTLRLIDNGIDQSYEWAADRSLARDMLAYLRDKLADHDKTFVDITGIGVCRGPGSFTGLRIGMVVLNTLASSLHIPIVGATGEAWQQGTLDRLERGENDRIVMPEYGSEANITTPRK